MTETKEIRSIYFSTPMLDDDYTFYEDGRVNRYYDRMQLLKSIG
jgi:hypothetical protein